MSEVIKVGRRKFTVLFPDLLRQLTQNEMQTLKNSIRKTGVVTPVIVDEEGGVIDGINRVRIAAEVGLANIPVSLRSGLSVEQKADLAIALNDARRHLTRAERERIRKEQKVRNIAAAASGKSTRAIAQEEGVSKDTVHRDAGCSGVAHETPEQAPSPPPKVTGRDEKQYPAKRDPEQKRQRRERVKAQRQEGKTVRQIASVEGVSVGQIHQDLQSVESQPELAFVDRDEEPAVAGETASTESPQQPSAAVRLVMDLVRALSENECRMLSDWMQSGRP